MTQISANIQLIREKVNAAAKKAGRNPDDIKIIAVTKTVEAAQINEALKCGITAIGENRVQEILRKYDDVEGNVQWHLIGHLQTNKVKYIVNLVDMIHSLDKIELAQEISKRALQNHKEIPVLVQVNISEEESKFGLKAEETESFIQEAAGYPGLKIMGLMTIAPYEEESEQTRPVFRELKELSQFIAGKNIPGVEMRYLSMGMTNDFEIAIEEGANLIRVGTAIFGARSYR
ncbi:YggS family pyridoxal phosphate-dependent enzyme [Bacillota bacterium LX-D]|nr:YggS family pyridoxal phosphate-dependent enzyme [Bacillota bacterium LX-D]